MADDDLVLRLEVEAERWGPHHKVLYETYREAAAAIEALQADLDTANRGEALMMRNAQDWKRRAEVAEARAEALRAEQAAWRMDAKGEHLRAENIKIAVSALIDAADEMYRISERKHDAWIAYATARDDLDAARGAKP